MAHLCCGELEPRAAACHEAQYTRRVARTGAAKMRECREFHDERQRSLPGARSSSARIERPSPSASARMRRSTSAKTPARRSSTTTRCRSASPVKLKSWSSTWSPRRRLQRPGGPIEPPIIDISRSSSRTSISAQERRKSWTGVL